MEVLSFINLYGTGIIIYVQARMLCFTEKQTVSGTFIAFKKNKAHFVSVMLSWLQIVTKRDLCFLMSLWGRQMPFTSLYNTESHP